MGFQTAVLNNIGFGVPGELYLEGPLRGQPAVLNTGTPANNVIGRAFTIVDDATGSFDTTSDPQPLEVAAGGTGVFAGILANPKVYSNVGTSAGGTLAPNLTLPNGTMVELVQECTGIIVQLGAACAIGDWVYYTDATGVLTTTAPNAAAPASSTRVPGGFVRRFESAAAGLAVISVNDDHLDVPTTGV
jgi:hypothetical protein